jgi:4'-phosphopantetheinyl transferase EntD
MNPARLSAPLAWLYPAGAVVAELREAGDPGLLLPAEAQFLGRALPKRVHEFAAGRLCARRALAEFGVHQFAIEVGADRQPLWPPLLAGSITHTAGFCAAVAAPCEHAAALGIDSEIVGDVNPQIWRSICLPSETAWIHSLPPARQAAAVTLVFCAKEAFYKCQFPVVHQRLNFHDVRIEAGEWGGAQGDFWVHATAGLAAPVRTQLPLQGRYLLHEQFITAGIAWRPTDLAQ